MSWSETHYETDYPLRCAMRTLAHNLAIAGGLCRAFRLGGRHADLIWDVDNWRDGAPWKPGCQKEAP